MCISGGCVLYVCTSVCVHKLCLQYINNVLHVTSCSRVPEAYASTLAEHEIGYFYGLHGKAVTRQDRCVCVYMCSME